LAALPNLTEENGQIIDRKLNVVLTRARKQLYLIGNERLLRMNELYNRLLEHINRLSQTLDSTHTVHKVEEIPPPT
jgi:DNA replication ATP-dependent helicase Dna2